jgi:hypothetical protein
MVFAQEPQQIILIITIKKAPWNEGTNPILIYQNFHSIVDYNFFALAEVNRK